MPNLENKTRNGAISIYHECLPPELAKRAYELFEEHREAGMSCLGSSFGGVNTDVKDSSDMTPITQLPRDHEFYKVSDEIEMHVFRCLVDYYKDNKGLLLGYFKGTNLGDYNSVEDIETIIARVFRLEHGQYQHYKKVEGERKRGGGYPANHAECCVQRHADPAEYLYRRLTWMLTLNELPVTKEQYGYTVFTNQKIAVRPKAGQLVLFSPWMDCEHRGNRVDDVEKSIITAWVSDHCPPKPE